ncbi:hypothetical protein DFJ63DRAFT_335302 [Scheffersomyces coipomensis]|uniref:uncharacterized protein n=1 Tax=Scheffersomyces coipomensis TaxID=1788519 RepID=UPI00315CDE17
MSNLTANQITSLHLYDLAHAVPLNPLSKQYSLLFHKFNQEKSINLPNNPNITHRICNSCGGVLIHGLTLSIRIKHGKVNKRKKKRLSKVDASDSNTKTAKRFMELKCLQCNHKEYNRDLIQPKQKEISQVSEPVETNPLVGISSSAVTALTFSRSQSPSFKAEWTPKSTNQVRSNSDKDNNSNSKSKERSKKRKQNNLSNLLQQKKQQKLNESKGIGSLSLSEFLK